MERGDDMYFAKERVNIITNELAGLTTVQSLPISGIRIKKGFYLTPAEADAAASPYEPFGEGSHWDGPDDHYWFTFDLTVPESFDGKPLWLYFCTQKTYWDAVNPSSSSL